MNPRDYADRYMYQLRRQNQGLLCSDCGSHSGHFSFCPLFHKGLPSTEYTGSFSVAWEEDVYDQTDRMLGISEGKPQPDSQSFYRKAKQAVNHAEFEFSKEDMEFAKSIGIKL